MISKEILDKIRLLEIKTRDVVNNLFSGEYHSVFKGSGMEFSEVREYFPGDDIRAIDWNVTARTGFPHVKKFKEEREVNVILLVDLSKSVYFGSNKQLKREIAGEIATILAFSAIKNNDKVGLLLFTDKKELYVPPGKTKKHIFRIIREILEFEPTGSKTNISEALQFLNRIQKKKSIIFLLSDFIPSEKNDTINYEKDLRIISKKHDFISIMINDIKEINFHIGGYSLLENRETGERIWIKFNKKTVEEYTKNFNKNKQLLKDIFKKNKVDFIEIDTSKPYIEPLIKFFKERERRM